MTEEHIIGWLESQMKIMDKEIFNLEKWVSQAKEEVKKSIQDLSGFEYRLERAKVLRSYLDELEDSGPTRIVHEDSVVSKAESDLAEHERDDDAYQASLGLL